MNNYYTDIQKNFIRKIKKKYSLNYINKILFKIKKIRVCLIGEPIIDKYIFTQVCGISSKSPTLASKFLYKEDHPGGAFAVANMLGKLGVKVDFIYYSDENKLTKLIERNLSKNINKTAIFKTNQRNKVPIIERIVNHPKYEKLHQMYIGNYFRHTKESITQLEKKINYFINKNNLIMVIDFGYDFLNTKIVNFLKKVNIFLNVHKNSSSENYYALSKYINKEYLTLNYNEYCNYKRLDISERSIKNIKKHVKLDKENKNFAVTLGSLGSILRKDNKITFCPAFYENLIDTTGSGDAFFTVTSLLNKINCEADLMLFLGNVYAAKHGSFFGNKTIVSADMLKNEIKLIYHNFS